MSADSLAQSPLFHPTTQLPRAAEQRQWLVPLLLATAAALLFAIVAVPRIDFEKAAADALDRGEGAAQMTPHDREVKLEQARKVAALATYSGAAFGTAVSALLAAFGIWLGFKVAGGTPGFAQTFTVACWALLPGAIEAVLTVPALLIRGKIHPDQLAGLLPANLGALVPAGVQGPLPSFLGAVDLFSLWAVWIVAAGMAGVARVSRRRALLTTGLLWLSYVAVFRVALPALAAR
ncbi:MAG TPA: YIP1 family protein [Anaeromyxobacteraceae bacterium]|nr:YIP1 family protein [Anaeromyxobacteraceae bacterium]